MTYRPYESYHELSGEPGHEVVEHVHEHDGPGLVLPRPVESDFSRPAPRGSSSSLDQLMDAEAAKVFVASLRGPPIKVVRGADSRGNDNVSDTSLPSSIRLLSKTSGERPEDGHIAVADAEVPTNLQHLVLVPSRAPTRGTLHGGVTNVAAALLSNPPTPVQRLRVASAIDMKPGQIYVTREQTFEQSSIHNSSDRPLSGVFLDSFAKDQPFNRAARRTSRERGSGGPNVSRRVGSLNALVYFPRREQRAQDYLMETRNIVDEPQHIVSALSLSPTVTSSGRPSLDSESIISGTSATESARIKRQDKTRARKLCDLQRTRHSIDEVVNQVQDRTAGTSISSSVGPSTAMPSTATTVKAGPLTIFGQVANFHRQRGVDDDAQHPALRSFGNTMSTIPQTPPQSSDASIPSPFLTSTPLRQRQTETPPPTSIGRSLHDGPTAIDFATLHHAQPLPPPPPPQSRVTLFQSPSKQTTQSLPDSPVAARPVAARPVLRVAPAAVDESHDAQTTPIPSKSPHRLSSGNTILKSERNTTDRPHSTHSRSTSPNSLFSPPVPSIQGSLRPAAIDTDTRMLDLERKVQLLTASLMAVLGTNTYGGGGSSNNAGVVFPCSCGAMPVPTGLRSGIKDSGGAGALAGYALHTHTHAHASPEQTLQNFAREPQSQRQPQPQPQPQQQEFYTPPEHTHRRQESPKPYSGVAIANLAAAADEVGSLRQAGSPAMAVSADLAAVAMQLYKISRALGVQNLGMA